MNGELRSLKVEYKGLTLEVRLGETPEIRKTTYDLTSDSLQYHTITEVEKNAIISKAQAITAAVKATLTKSPATQTDIVFDADNNEIKLAQCWWLVMGAPRPTKFNDAFRQNVINKLGRCGK